MNIVLKSFSHFGVGYESKVEIDRLCDIARERQILIKEPIDFGYPVGYWAFIRDPDGHTLELSYGQEIGIVATPAE